MPFVNASTVAAGSVTLNTLVPPNVLHGRVRSAIAEFTAASDAQGTYTAPIVLPKGCKVLFCFLNASVTMGGTATIAIGISGATGKYRAAATYTSADTWTTSALNAAVGATLAADEQILVTVAAAALPSSGRLLIGFFYVID